MKLLTSTMQSGNVGAMVGRAANPTTADRSSVVGGWVVGPVVGGGVGPVVGGGVGGGVGSGVGSG